MDCMYPFGIPIEPRSWWGYLVSISVILQVVCPAHGGFVRGPKPAQEGHARRCGHDLERAATMLLFFVQGPGVPHRRVAFLIANLAFGASIVVYNAFLPEIATPESATRSPRKAGASAILGGGIVLAL